MWSIVVNFEKSFLHQFSTKIYQTLRDDVKTSKKWFGKKSSAKYYDFFPKKIVSYFWGVKTALCKISQILDENQWRNNLSKLTTFDPIFQLNHSALIRVRGTHGLAHGKKPRIVTGSRWQISKPLAPCPLFQESHDVYKDLVKVLHLLRASRVFQKYWSVESHRWYQTLTFLGLVGNISKNDQYIDYQYFWSIYCPQYI